MDLLAFLAAIGFLFLAIGHSLRLLFPGRVGEITLGMLLRDFVLLVLRACVFLLLLPFRLILRQLSFTRPERPALRREPPCRHRPRHRRRRRARG